MENKWSYTETETHVEINYENKPFIFIHALLGKKIDMGNVRRVIVGLNRFLDAEPFEEIAR